MFPSPIGVIFSLILNEKEFKNIEKAFKFPSPIGVIFSLISMYKFATGETINEFPSPIGVIFSLI